MNARQAPALWLVLCGAGVGVFVVVTVFVFEGGQASEAGAAAFDRAFAEFLVQFRTRALTGRVIELSALGSAPVLMVFALFAYVFVLRARDRLGFLHLSVALLGAGVLARVIQGMFERDRPDTLLPFVVVTEGSFPSAHLFGAAASYVTFAFFYARYVPGRIAAASGYVVASVLILIIGLTRVYLGAHHATDVIAGIAGGVAWACLVAAVVSAWYRRTDLERFPRGQADRTELFRDRA